MIEAWKEIKDYPHYHVSNLGNIKRVIPNQNGETGAMKPNISKNGYPRLNLYNGGGRKTMKLFYFHHLVMQTFCGEMPKNMQVNHKNGKKSDNRLSNLEYCTPRKNMRHAVKMGLQKGRKTIVLKDRSTINI